MGYMRADYSKCNLAFGVKHGMGRGEGGKYVALLFITFDKHLGHVRVAYPKCDFLGTFGVHGKGGGKYVSLLFITPTHGHIKSARMTGETMMIVTKIMNFG